MVQVALPESLCYLQRYVRWGRLVIPPLPSLAVVVDVSGWNYAAIGIIKLNLKLASRCN